MKHSNELATEQLVNAWAAEGKLVEGGWEAFAQRNLRGASEEQVAEMRKAWMLGAQHLYAILLHLGDSDRKVKFIDLIAQELREFQRFYLAKAAHEGQ